MHIPIYTPGCNTTLTSHCTYLPMHIRPTYLYTHLHTNQTGFAMLSHCRPAYPKILLSILQTAYVRIFRFFTRFFVDAPPISQNKTVSNFVSTYANNYISSCSYFLLLESEFHFLKKSNFNSVITGNRAMRTCLDHCNNYILHFETSFSHFDFHPPKSENLCFHFLSKFLVTVNSKRKSNKVSKRLK